MGSISRLPILPTLGLAMRPCPCARARSQSFLAGHSRLVMRARRGPGIPGGGRKPSLRSLGSRAPSKGQPAARIFDRRPGPQAPLQMPLLRIPLPGHWRAPPGFRTRLPGALAQPPTRCRAERAVGSSAARRAWRGVAWRAVPPGSASRAQPRGPAGGGLTYWRGSAGPGWRRTTPGPRRCSAWCPGTAAARSCCPGCRCSSPPRWSAGAGAPPPPSCGRRR